MIYYYKLQVNNVMLQQWQSTSNKFVFYVKREGGKISSIWDVHTTTDNNSTADGPRSTLSILNVVSTTKMDKRGA